MASTPSSSSSHKLRKDVHIKFVGYISKQVVGRKLLSNRQVLRGFFFYNVSVVNLKARIPIRKKYHCIDKLLKLCDEWKV